MDNDDEPIGRLLTRREMLKLMAAMGAAAAAAACAPRLTGPAATSAPASGATTAPTTAAPTVGATAASSPTAASTAAAAVPTAIALATATVPVPACVVRPEQTEGPYFVDVALERSDIRSDPADGIVVAGGGAGAGIPLALRFNVSRLGDDCRALPGAVVDVWQCDAEGVYSGVNDRNFGNTAGTQFLRGHQVTADDGGAAFTTIYPGWYRGRATHIHFKIRTEEAGRNYEFTSQLYFDDAFTDAVYAREPYNARDNNGRTLNSQDGIFRNGGDLLTLDVSETADGFAAVFDIGLNW